MTPGGFLIAKVFLAGYLEATRSCLNDRLSTIRRSALTPAFKVSRETTSPTAMTLGGLVSRIMRASWGIVSSAGPGTSLPNGVLSLARSSGLGLRVILSPQWQKGCSLFEPAQCCPRRFTFSAALQRWPERMGIVVLRPR